MSVHRECGEDIRWAHRPDDPERFLPPLEYAGEVYVIDEGGSAIQMHGYRMHRCDPQKVIEWQTYIEQMKDLKGDDSYEGRINYRQAASERNRDEQWEIALKVECPKCELDPGMKCCSLKKQYRESGELIELRWPHPERTELALHPKREEIDDAAHT